MMRQATLNEWKYWPEREDATLREQTALGVYTGHDLTASGGAIKRRAPTWKEMTASNGAYTGKNLVFLLPTANLPDDVAPKVGDVIRDAANVDHTILEAMAGKFGNTWRCVTIALALVNGLASTGTLSRPDNERTTAGRPTLANYTAVAENVACRVQPEGGSAAEVAGRVTIPKRFTAYLGVQVDARAKDRFVCGGVTYTVLEMRQPERLDQLMSLTLEKVL